MNKNGRLYLLFAALLVIMAGCGPDPFFIPVESIEGVPIAGTTGMDLVLTGRVNPGFASKTTIDWTLLDRGKTDARRNGNILYTSVDGTVSIQARIANGAAGGKDYIQNFEIEFNEGSGSTIPQTFNSVDDLNNWLFTRDPNYPANPYSVKLNVNAIPNISALPANRYIDLDLSDSTFTDIIKDVFVTNSIVSITIPNTVEYIEQGEVFDKCKNLIAIKINGDNQYFSSQDGVLYDKNQKSLIAYPPGKQNDSFTIPYGVESLAHSSFANCINLTKVIIPLTSTPGSGTFLGVKTIGESAFLYCGNLVSVTIGESVTSIGVNAFDGCSSLSSVTFEGAITQNGFGYNSLPDELRNAYLSTTGGGPGTYTKTGGSTGFTWIRE